jgi:hypothetical protein
VAVVSFVQQQGQRVIGVLRGWDRLRLRGTFRAIAFAKGVVSFFKNSNRPLEQFASYLTSSTDRLCEAAEELTKQAGRPKIYLDNPGVSKEELAREIAQRDGITQGLICTLTAVEPCGSFRLIKNKDGKGLGVQSAYRKCLHIYHYHQHPVFGLMHLRIQTWLPFNLHLCLNGREWLARQMDQAGIRYLRKQNCFSWIQDVAAAQALMQQQVDFHWEEAMANIVQEMHPAIERVVHPYNPDYYWSMEESEWATDLMFRSEAELSLQYGSLLRHGIESFGSRDVMRFLGQRVPAVGPCHPRDYREYVSDIKARPEGVRIKHRMGRNSIKMYNKQGSVLRIETTLNDMRQLKSPRREKGKVVWKTMRKGVADARQRAAFSDQANERYLGAMAAVGTELPLKALTNGLSRPVTWQGRQVRGMHLLAEEDTRLLTSVGAGEFLLHGFRNGDLQKALFAPVSEDPKEQRRRSGQVTRKLRLLRAHGLIRKLPRTHRYQVTDKGRQVIAALAAARNAGIAQLLKAA